MSRQTSEGAGKRYGLKRVCRVLEFPRSTLYDRQARESATEIPLCPQRRGPKPKVADIDLLAAIRADLEASPFIGEGHRTVWARLRILHDIRVSRARVLRLMRENAWLSPNRRPQGRATLHAGSITTDRPNAMWGTDGIRIETVDEGWVWVFSAVDHFDACCVGIHTVKTGNRFAASFSGTSTHVYVSRPRMMLPSSSRVRMATPGSPWTMRAKENSGQCHR